MNKLALVILAGASAAIFSLSAPKEADAGKSCARTEFKTELIKNACAKGGQKEAKKAMRKFMKQAKKATKEKITCTSCHSKASGKYPLKKKGLELFMKYKKAI